MNKPNIVFLGHVCIDHNTVEGHKYTNWGSPAMFMAKYFAANFDIQPTIITSYGDDFLPYAGTVKLVPSMPNIPKTLVYENVVQHGYRTQYCHHADSALPPDITTKTEQIIAAADIVFFAPLTPHYASEHVEFMMQHASEHCLRVLLPQGYMRAIGHKGLVQAREFEEASDILPYFDLITLSDEDHPHAILRAQEWKRLSPTTEIIVTQNASGADIIDRGTSQHIPTEPVPTEEIIDSVGCGDVFTAATAYHLQQTGNLEQAVKFGHAAARIKLLALNG